ncbi:50S ribosomal protein L11 methyltransferase [uncultured Clostridium sp.]|jgi:ribosomal protein L11 methyltransferase|uniref:50S ribosomal protein L11 methyltransferase n=1 Tax=uncultured Clostridium sp. TaxID=59620 RepID=UPI00260EDA60|nr:50S ribosomal protein L11 methyltransferase [uncultured Clostridium sp.]
MFIITFKTNSSDIDAKIEKLQLNDVFNTYYEAALNITTDNWGYGYEEKENEILDLHIVFDADESKLEAFLIKISDILDDFSFEVKEENYNYEETIFPSVQINDSWILINPNEESQNINRINFISQGAFGTGLHETTKDILSLILKKDFSNKTVMDIGTGSGILAIATALKSAKKVTAVDIRDVEEEVMLNASFNDLSTIEVKVGNALTNDFTVDPLYDWIYINIGGEETQMFMEYIDSHLKKDGMLLVSGLVEWSFDFVKSKVEEHSYEMTQKLQTNEWCTAIFKKIQK